MCSRCRRSIARCPYTAKQVPLAPVAATHKMEEGMDAGFCTNWIGDGSPGQNRHCRVCSHRVGPCQDLWLAARQLATPSFQVPAKAGEAPLTLSINRDSAATNPDVLYFKVTSDWSLPIEDFLYFVRTRSANRGLASASFDPQVSPTKTRQGPFIERFLGRLPPHLIAAVRAIPSKKAAR